MQTGKEIISPIANAGSNSGNIRLKNVSSHLLTIFWYIVEVLFYFGFSVAINCNVFFRIIA